MSYINRWYAHGMEEEMLAKQHYFDYSRILTFTKGLK